MNFNDIIILIPVFAFFAWIIYYRFIRKELGGGCSGGCGGCKNSCHKTRCCKKKAAQN